MTLILSGTNGVSDIDGDASTPAVRGTDANSGIFFGADTVGVSTGGSEKVSVGASAVVVNDGGADVDFRVEGDTDANLLFVDASTDRVGIGTSSPGARLNPAFDGTSGSTAELVRLTNGSGGGSGTGTSLTYYHSLNTGALVEGGRIAVVKEATWTTTASTQDANMQFWTTENGTAAERMRINSSGNLLVGTTSDSAGVKLKVAGGIIGCLDVFNNTSGAAANMNIDGNGFFARSTSSLKYKKDIQDATHGLKEVLKLRFVTYKSKSERDGETVFGGLIAEEVHDAGLAEFVQYNEAGEPDALAYGNMVSLAFKAIQELKAELDTVKAELATLKG